MHLVLDRQEQLADLSANGLPPEAVADTIYKALTVKNPPVRYAVNPKPFESWLMSILPKRYLDGIIAKRLGLHK